MQGVDRCATRWEQDPLHAVGFVGFLLVLPPLRH